MSSKDNHQSEKPLRWGIFSAGQISYDFCVALSTLPSSEHRVVHVGARSADSAKDFATKFDIPKWSGDYEAVAKDPDVDVV